VRLWEVRLVLKETWCRRGWHIFIISRIRASSGALWSSSGARYGAYSLQIGNRWAVLLCIGSMLPLASTRVQAVDDEMALALRQNGVRIETEWKRGGFGFIVGKRGGFL